MNKKKAEEMKKENIDAKNLNDFKRIEFSLELDKHEDIKSDQKPSKRKH